MRSLQRRLRKDRRWTIVEHNNVDPDLVPGIEFFPSPDGVVEDLGQAREALRALFESAGLVDDLPVEPAEIMIERPDGDDLRLLLFDPGNSVRARPAILHFHSGGFVLGRADFSTAANAMLSAEFDCVVLSVDYRLAPETRFPGAVEDGYAALGWLFANANRLNIDVGRVAVAGESAGGGLAAALALMARDRGEYGLCHQQLVYPMLDDRTCNAEPAPPIGRHVWTPAANRFGWSALLGSEPGGEEVSCYAAPARAEDLSGLPPAFISVGGLDLFLDEDIAYARRLLSAGVPTELHVYPGAYHAFDLIPDAPVSHQANDAARAALRRAFRP